MSRIRTIKPEFWTSEQVAFCSRDARLLFVGMWNFCDDGGIHQKSYKRLKMEIFPGDDCSIQDINGWISELIMAGLIVEYTRDSEDYWQVTGWKSHQKIDKPYYRHPPPYLSTETRQEETKIRLPFVDHSANGSRTVVDHSPPEWNGREGKG